MDALKVGKLRKTPIVINAPPEFAHLAPSRKKHSVELELSNCRNTVPNALRRVIMSELTIVGLNTSTDACDTDDWHLFDMLEMIVQRVKMIPIDQNTAIGARYRIDVKNKTSTTMHVTLADLKPVGAAPPNAFEKNIVLLDLQPHLYFRCDMHVDELYASSRTNGCRAVASGVRSVLAKPDDAYNQYTGEGTPVMMSDHQNWVLRFDTNGIMSAESIIDAACTNILRRLHIVHTVVAEGDFKMVNGEHRLTIPETVTIGELVLQKIYYSQSDVDSVFLSVDDKATTVTFRIKTNNDPVITINGAVDQLLADFELIKKSV